MLTSKDYQDAIMAQSACNLSGLLFSFSRVMEKICDESNKFDHGTEWKNSHAICRMYAEQIYHLTRNTDFFKAYDECEKLSKEKK